MRTCIALNKHNVLVQSSLAQSTIPLTSTLHVGVDRFFICFYWVKIEGVMGVFMIIGVIFCVTNAFFMESLL